MARWFYYKANGSGWLHVDETVYRAENMDEALDMLDGIAPCLCGDFVSPLSFLSSRRTCPAEICFPPFRLSKPSRQKLSST